MKTSTLSLLLGGALVTAAILAPTSASAQTVVVSTGYYTPMTYEGCLVYFDDYGRPFIWVGEERFYIPTTYAYYTSYVNHYRGYRTYYQRWYREHGYRHRGYRHPGARGHVAPNRGHVAPGRRYVAPNRGHVAPGRRYVAPGRGYVAPANRGASAPARRATPPARSHGTRRR
jgi:hypothetical protein